VEMVVDGLSVHYEEQGQGPLVVLLHGWGSNLSLFAPIAEAISRNYHVVSFDFPGCGTTSEPTEPWDMDDYVHFTTSFISAFSPTEVILLGHSHGGRVAIRLACDEGLPFRVTRMILVDSAGILPHRSVGYHLRVRAYKIGKALLATPPLKALFPNALEAFQTSMGSTDYAAASPVMRGSLVRVVNANLEPLLPKITAETLLIWGENDDATPLCDGQTMERLIAGSGLVVLPKAGHFSFLDQSYTFRKVIESFLRIG
jgi:pimeloyl-ACP methyl ester carboxylesterase